eukprot:6953472-Heterocapsa_arctica.AAC.1
MDTLPSRRREAGVGALPRTLAGLETPPIVHAVGGPQCPQQLLAGLLLGTGERRRALAARIR